MSDPDQLDYFFTDDDIVTAVFDRATDLGANEARRGPSPGPKPQP